MSFRFRRTVRILPGIRLNFGKRGVSTSIGRRGASVTVGERGVYGNVGLPGSGISYRERLDGGPGRRPRPHRRSAWGLVLMILAVVWLLAAIL